MRQAFVKVFEPITERQHYIVDTISDQRRNEDYKEMLQILLEEKVKFIVVGAYALSAHGYPRATGDIDIWIEPTGEFFG